MHIPRPPSRNPEPHLRLHRRQIRAKNNRSLRERTMRNNRQRRLCPATENDSWSPQYLQNDMARASLATIRIIYLDCRSPSTNLSTGEDSHTFKWKLAPRAEYTLSSYIQQHPPRQFPNQRHRSASRVFTETPFTIHHRNTSERAHQC